MTLQQERASEGSTWGEIERKPCLLIVDDEPMILESLEDLLEDDFQVFTASDPRKALDLLRHHEISVLVTDQRMPGLTGDELLARASHMSGATRVLITGYSDLQALSRAVNRGHIYAYVAKPWNPMELRVTLRQAAEHYQLLRAIDRERRLLQQLMDSSEDLIFFTDPDGRILRVNQAAARLVGMEADELIGRLPSAVLPTVTGVRIDHDIRKVRETGRPVLDQIDPLPHPEGTRWFSTTITPRTTPKGEFLGIVGIARDVTERIEASRALEQRARQQECLARLSQDALAGEEPEELAQGLGAVLVHGLGRGGVRIFRAEPTGLRLVGSAGEGAGAAATEPSEAARRAYETGVVEWGRTDAGLVAAPIPEESRSWGIVEASVPTPGCLRPDEAHFLEAAANVLAMALRAREARNALVRAEQQFHQAQKMEALGRLAGGVAHDFNNLLTVIRGGCELIEGELVAGHTAREALGAVQDAAGRAGELTSRLLRFSRREEARPRVLDLNSALVDSELILRRVLGERVELVAHYSPVPCPVRMDPGQFDQVLMNLVVNARDAMPEGGLITLSLALVEAASEDPEGRPAGRCVRLQVSDAGVGMDAATRARIFEPFFTTKDADRGTGLGLATVMEVVRRFGGAVAVESAPGQGTTFSLDFPLAAAEAEPPRECVAPDHPRTCTETILVVDDDASVRTTVVRGLKRLGYKVLEAADGPQALEAAGRHDGPLQLLVTDVGLPRMTGLELAARLQAERPGLEVLLMSGYGIEDLGIAGEADTSLELLAKPFTFRELGFAVRRTLDRPSSPAGAP